MDIDMERKLKQSYLRQAIVEEGYDTQSFLAFIKNRHEDGDKIDTWSLTDLQNVSFSFSWLKNSRE
jgi:hypothetical protein